MTGRPLVSVIVPVYNGERFLGQTLDCLLAQDYEPVEVIVVDDGSTDDSVAVAATRPVRCLRRPHEGVSAARNAGIAEARGDLIGFLDADDLWTPDAVRTQAEPLIDHPELGFVLPQKLVFVEPNSPLPWWYRRVFEVEPIVSLLPMVRKEVFGEVGLFDPSYAMGEDLEWLARAKDLGIPRRVLPDVLLKYRMHGANSTYALTGPEHMLRVLRASVGRRRPGPEDAVVG